MIMLYGSMLSGKRVPRIRGDGPLYQPSEAVARECSPHTRGWTAFRTPDLVSPTVFRAYTHEGGPKQRPEQKIDAACSPRMRGWTAFIASHTHEMD